MKLKLYSKRSLVIKAIFCLMLAPIYMLASSLVNIDDAFIFTVVGIVPIGCLYTIPFWFTAVYLKKYRCDSLKKILLYDFISCVCPAFFGMLFSEIIYTIVNGTSFVDGIVTVIFAFVFLIITLVFWISYFICIRA